ncbi:MAG: uridine kinase [Bacteroidia bacterium]|nr:uridine kinase [Bacteroidia bacterium]
MTPQAQKSYFVGISGGSASGKTFLLNKLLEHFPSEIITLISQDNYYKNLNEQKKDAEGHVNFDHPEAVNLHLLERDIALLKAGETVSMMEYTFNNPNIIPKKLVFRPSPIILVEGLFVFYEPKISSQLDLKIFVDADEHIKLSRRIKRDYEERGYDLEEVLYRYEHHVIPMYKKYVAPFKEECDLIIPNNFHMEKALQVLLDHLHARISG